MGRGGRGHSAAVGRKLGVVDQQVKLGAATRVGAKAAVVVEVQLSRVHHFSEGDMGHLDRTTGGKPEDPYGGSPVSHGLGISQSCLLT